jgi:hypothetical protein
MLEKSFYIESSILLILETNHVTQFKTMNLFILLRMSVLLLYILDLTNFLNGITKLNTFSEDKINIHERLRPYFDFSFIMFMHIKVEQLVTIIEMIYSINDIGLFFRH